MRSWRLACLEATQEWASALAAVVSPPAVLFLEGNLGAGKTALARAFIQACGYTSHVRSPTYTLVEPYDTVAGRILHMDLYRLAEAEELEYLGIRDYLAVPAVWLVEWPERASPHLPAPDLRIRMELEPDASHRADVSACSVLGEKILFRLMESPDGAEVPGE